uniref:SLIT and NTRK-like family, member 3a n=1 Tax=Acanthochromis polyacanthus TaxID=80966 RepID=A0A3Q1EWH5_9TELE
IIHWYSFQMRMLWVTLLSTIPCFEPCYCEVKEGIFHVHCDSKGFTNVSQISQIWSRPFKLNLQRNSMRKLYFNSFLHLNNAISINLGNNALQDIHAGAFNGLGILKRLFLHENKLEVFRNDTFLGLDSLEYLQADYNVIKRIESGAFRHLHKLRLVFLNDNLLRSLPTDAFAGTNLARLNLRNNYFLSMPVRGVLEHLHSIVQIDLHQNPWECSCDIIPLKQWLEKLSSVIVVGDVLCKTPEFAFGKDLRSLEVEVICPELKYSSGPSPALPGGDDLTTGSSDMGEGQSFSFLSFLDFPKKNRLFCLVVVGHNICYTVLLVLVGCNLELKENARSSQVNAAGFEVDDMRGM